MSVLVYDCGSVENTVTAILDTESGAMIIRGNGDIDNYADESSPWYSEHSDILQVTVDKGITRIGSGTFYGCENLSFVEIASTVTSIGADVFQNCTSLTSIKIPKSITDVGNGTFTDSGLTEVKFYGNPPTVGTDIFDGVTADIYTPEENEEWTETAKGTVAGNGSNLTWKEFDSKPNLIEYDELDYLWSKIKKYVDSNVSVTQVVSSGTKIATITINGVTTDLYSSPFSGTIGDSTTPIYIDNGVPTACGGSLAVDITGNAATATSATSATTATNANNAKLTHTVGDTYYPIVLASSAKIDDSAQSLRIGCATTTLLNCALRGKTYYGAANTQGESVLVIGNNIAKTSANNSRGGLTLYGTGAYYLHFRSGDVTASRTVTLLGGSSDVTLTLPSSTGTLALTSSNITGSSASCTGNAATATTATTATNATKAELSTLLSTDSSPLVLASSHTGTTGYQSLRIASHNTTSANNPLRAYGGASNSTAQGDCGIIVGNNINNGTAYNKRGNIRLYGTNTGYTQITPSNNTTSNITVNLPSSAGTLALTSSNITGNAATATTASACSGNAASSTYSTYASVTQTSSNTAYDVMLAAHNTSNTTSNDRTLRSAVNSTTAAHSALRFNPGADASASGTTVNSELIIGNSLANNDSTNYAKNRRGRLSMYGTGSTYLSMYVNPASSKTITLKTSGTTAREYTLPDKAGTFAMTSDIPDVTSYTNGGVTVTNTATSTNSKYICQEITFQNDFKLKFVYLKSATAAAQTANEVITFVTPFTTIVHYFMFCFVTGGRMRIYGATNNTNVSTGGWFDFDAQNSGTVYKEDTNHSYYIGKSYTMIGNDIRPYCIISYGI